MFTDQNIFISAITPEKEKFIGRLRSSLVIPVSFGCCFLEHVIHIILVGKQHHPSDLTVSLQPLVSAEVAWRLSVML